MRSRVFAFLMTNLMWAASVTPASAHCEIPCGIYDDQLRAKQAAATCPTDLLVRSQELTS